MSKRKKTEKVTSEDIDVLAAVIKLVADNDAAREPEQQTLPVLNCSHGCIQKAMASQIVLEALASTIWEPAENKYQGYEYLVTDIALIELTKGRQTFGVTIQAINQREEKEDIQLHKFLTNYVPVRQINVKDYQS